MILLIITGAIISSVSAQNIQYNYDSQNRLIEVSYSDKIVRYTYDDAGNRSAMTIENLVSAPSIVSLNPNNLNAGSAGFTLIVTGANFTNNSVVQWNGVARPTTFINAGEVQVIIPAGDVAATGSAVVAVVNSTPVTSFSNARNFIINAPPTASSENIGGRITDLNGLPLAKIFVTLTHTDGTVQTISTDGNGNYLFQNIPVGATYVLSPSSQNYTFTPNARVFTLLETQTDLDFTGAAAVFTISGRISNFDETGLSGIKVLLSGSQNASTVTDDNGNFSFVVAAGGNYTVTPVIAGREFKPLRENFINLNTNQTANFVVLRDRTPFRFSNNSYDFED